MLEFPTFLILRFSKYLQARRIDRLKSQQLEVVDTAYNNKGYTGGVKMCGYVFVQQTDEF